METHSLLSELTNRNYNIVIISSRGFHPNAEEITKKWFIKTICHLMKYIFVWNEKIRFCQDRKISFAVVIMILMV